MQQEYNNTTINMALKEMCSNLWRDIFVSRIHYVVINGVSFKLVTKVE